MNKKRLLNYTDNRKKKIQNINYRKITIQLQDAPCEYQILQYTKFGFDLYIYFI